MKNLVLLLASIAVLSIPCALTDEAKHSFTVEVHPRDEVCFYEDVSTGDIIQFEAVLLPDGYQWSIIDNCLRLLISDDRLSRVVVRIVGPDGKIMYYGLVPYGVPIWKSTSPAGTTGACSICFSLSGRQWTHQKRIRFAIKDMHSVNWEANPIGRPIRRDELDPVLKSIKRLRVLVRDLARVQERMKFEGLLLSRTNRLLSMSISFWWKFKVASIIGMNLAQLAIVYRWFSRHSYGKRRRP